MNGTVFCEPSHPDDLQDVYVRTIYRVLLTYNYVYVCSAFHERYLFIIFKQK